MCTRRMSPGRNPCCTGPIKAHSFSSRAITWCQEASCITMLVQNKSSLCLSSGKQVCSVELLRARTRRRTAGASSTMLARTLQGPNQNVVVVLASNCQCAFAMSHPTAAPSGIIKTRRSSWLDAQSKRPKSILITGCDSGIGKTTAIRLANKGWRVFAGVLSERAANDIRQHNASIVALTGLDVTDQESVDKAVTRVRDAVGNDGLQGLVNNAGIASSIPLEFIPMELFDRIMQVNLYGALRMCQACLPLLRLGKVKGRIVNIGSVLGSAPGPLVGGYSPSKSALEAMTTTMRLELKKQGIHVCIVKPAVIRTNIYKETLAVTAKAREQLPEEAEQLYGQIMDEGIAYIKHISSNSRGVSPNVVAHAVNKALKETWPSASYPAGIESRALLFARWYLPDWLMDKATLYEMRMR